MIRLRLLPQKTEFDFFSRANFFSLTSVIIVGISIFIYLIFGLNFGIDFRGGTLLMVQSEKPVAVSEYRQVLRSLNLGDTSVTKISDPKAQFSGGLVDDKRNIVLIRIEQEKQKDDVENDKIILLKKSLSDAFGVIIFLQTESVGAKVSKELVIKGMTAVLLAVGAVLFYIWIRFEWQFALGAVLALVHDVLITIGIFSLFRLEFNLSIVAAILTIVGYSLNDTVIVYDRIRENLKKFNKKPLLEVLNISINETLSRTLVTSITTLLALLSLYFLGGDVLRGFTFAMIWGVLIGTYSSIFIASAILLRLGVKRDWSKPDNEAGTRFTGANS